MGNFFGRGPARPMITFKILLKHSSMAEKIGENSNNSNSGDSNVSHIYNDPFYISNSDQTMNKLVAISLNATNFVSWKRNVKRALIAKNTIGFLDGSIAKPKSTSKDLNRWIRCDYLVTCWLVTLRNLKLVRISLLWRVLLNCGMRFVRDMVSLMDRKFINWRKILRSWNKKICQLLLILARWRDIGMSYKIWGTFVWL